MGHNYTLVRMLHPPMMPLAAVKAIKATAYSAPANKIKPSYDPPFTLLMAPAIGIPVSAPKLEMKYAVPILFP